MTTDDASAFAGGGAQATPGTTPVPSPVKTPADAFPDAPPMTSEVDVLDVTAEGAGFDGDSNVVTLFARDGHETPLPIMSKFDVANCVLDEVLRLKDGAR